MRCFTLVVLMLGLTMTVFPQLNDKMVVHKKNGSKYSYFFADVDSISLILLNIDSVIRKSPTMIAVDGGSIPSFSMGKYEVAFEEWTPVRSWGNAHGYDLPVGQAGYVPGTTRAVNNPVSLINWYEAVKWCNALSESEERTPVYYTSAGFETVYRLGEMDPYVNADANGYRLPTDAEFEFAAIGGNSMQFPWLNYPGSNNIDDVAWYAGNSTIDVLDGRSTHSVGTKSPNELGFYDLAGNVNEYCWDLYNSGNRIVRGGSFQSSEIGCRSHSSYSRGGANPKTRFIFTGFRVVRSR